MVKGRMSCGLVTLCSFCYVTVFGADLAGTDDDQQCGFQFSSYELPIHRDNVGHLSVGFNSGVPAAWCHNDLNRGCGGAESPTARASAEGSVRRLRHQIY